MEDFLLFSIVFYDMYINDDPNNKWFDIDKIEILNTKIHIVPLFNIDTHPERDVWDQSVFGQIKIVISLIEFDDIGEFSNEVSSYEYPFEARPEKENIYEINLRVIFDEIKTYITDEFSYSLLLSYYLSDAENHDDDLLSEIYNNHFFMNTIPFIKNGGWYDGK